MRRVAIVTGSSSGVGRALVIELAALGYDVVVNYSRGAAAAEEVVSACRAFGGEALAVQADVGQEAACEFLVERTISTFGRVDVLVNNAGTTKFVDLADLDGLSSDDFLSIYRVNLVGPFLLARACRSHLIKSGRGNIVNVASVAGLSGVGSCIAYAASKAALLSLTKSLAIAMGPDIRVNAVCPGFIQGDWLRNGLGDAHYERVRSHIEATAPMKTTATASGVAKSVVGLIESSWEMTGQYVVVDGGYSLV